jgi:ferritin
MKISNELMDAMVDQMNYELLSEFAYIAMAAHLKKDGLDGFANYFMVQAAEERFHAMKFYNYINEQGGHAKIAAIPESINSYDSVLAIVEEALEHERRVTARIYNLMDIATKDREYATISFLNWYVDEQVEEEDNMQSMIDKLNRIGDNQSAFYHYDEQLAARVFTPPVK